MFSFTSGMQLPHPSPAPDRRQSSSKSLQPAKMSSSRFPFPTVLQEQTSLPLAGSAAFPGRSNAFLFSPSSSLFSISDLNSANSDLSPMRTAPTRRSSLIIHFL